MSVRLRPYTPADRKPYLALYEAAFPASERKEFSFMTEGSLSPAYDLLVIETDKESVAGLVILVSHGQFILLDYLAVSPSLRGQGIGHAVLPLIRAFCASNHPGAHLFLEIETPTPGCENNAQRLRRKAFYLSAGLCETGVHAKIYGTDMELLSYPEDAPFVTFAAYADLLSATFPDGMTLQAPGEAVQ
ncbi:MAG: GNAT family N-acetyltransferase [Eubacteriales bacterium]